MKNNFDDILKKKWEEFHFPVDDQHRADMIRLLDGQKRRRIGLFWWFGAITTVIGVAMIMLSLDASEQNANAHFGSTESKASLENTVTSSSNSTTDTVSNTSVPTVTVDQSEHPTGDLKRNESLSNNKTGPVGQHSQTRKEGSVNKNQMKSAEKATGASSDLSTDKKHNIPNTANPGFAQNTEASEAGLEDDIKSALTDNTNESTASAPINEPSHTMRDASIIMEIADLPFGTLTHERTVEPSIQPGTTRINDFAIFAEGGMGLVPALKPHFNTGWTVHAGGGLKYAVSSRTDLSLSGGYMMQNGGFDFERTSTVHTNSFAARSNFNTLSPDKLHFMYAKVGIQHSIRRHLLSMYGGLQYLYGVQGYISVLTQDAITGITESTRYAWLKPDGMQRYLWNVSAQYGYRISPKLSLHAGVKYYLTNIEATDPELQSKGYYWNGRMSQVNPFLTLNYQLYERN